MTIQAALYRWYKSRKIEARIAGKRAVLKLLGRGERPKRWCPVCDSAIVNFAPMPEKFFAVMRQHGYIYDIDDAEMFNYRHYLCPFCSATDRDRVLALYVFREFLPKNSAHPIRMLDFAPGTAFEWKCRRDARLKVTSTDLKKRDVDVPGNNIEDMKAFGDGVFDFFICSHVLEHVTYPKKAVAELHRVLSTGGKGVILTPIVKSLKVTQEDPAHTTEAERWKYYGQFDHLRMFAKNDLIKTIESAGFRVQTWCVEEVDANLLDICAISPKAFLYIAQKNSAGNEQKNAST